MTVITSENVVLDGWLTKKAMKSGRNWKRRFFVLKDNAMIYYDEQPTALNDKSFKPRGLVEITADSVVRLSPVAKRFAFELVTKPQVLCVHAESKAEQDTWMTALKEIIAHLQANRASTLYETRRGWLTKRAVRSGRNWKRRFFLLRNSRLSYYDQPPQGPSDKPKGMIELSKSTIVKEEVANTIAFGKKHVFLVENDDLTLHLSADSIEERDKWITAILLAILRRMGINTESATRVGVWLRQLGLQQYIGTVVCDAGLNTFNKIKQVSEERLKHVFKLANFSLNDARKMQLAIRELQSMRESELEVLGSVEHLFAKGLVKSDKKKGGNKAQDEAEMDEEEQKESLLARKLKEKRGSTSKRMSWFSSEPKTHVLERRLYTWGDDSGLQLGIGSSAGGLTSEPTHVIPLKNKTEPKKIVAGKNCMACVTVGDGKLFTWGTGDHLGLGRGKTVSNRPFLVAALNKKVVSNVAIGSTHMAAVTQDGQAFTWGTGSDGQLGLGKDRTSVSEPEQVDAIGFLKITNVCCGPNHTLFLDQSGGVHACGNGGCGRLGLGHETDVYVPTQVDSLNGQAVAQIACGDEFSIAVLKNGTTTFWWGRLGGEQGPFVPVRMANFDSRKVDQVDAAGDMAIFLIGLKAESSESIVNTSVYTVGNGGILMGLADDIPRQVPAKVELLEGHGVIQVSCSPTHVGAACEDGRILMWGEDHCGQLGSGYMVNVSRPHLAMGIAGYKFVQVSCGINCTAAVGEYDPLYKGTEMEKEVPYGTVTSPPPPPEETIQADDREQEKLNEMMQHLTNFINQTGVEASDDEDVAPPPTDDDSGEVLPPGTVKYCEGWLEHTDRKTGRSYYENIDTGKVQWDPPQF